LDRYAFALVLLVISLFTLTPARAEQAQPRPGAIVLHLTGQATGMNSTVGSLESAILDLAGGGLGDGQGGLMIQNLTGNLQIGSANYPIYAGDGKTDTLGNFMMLGESNSGELVLQGIIQHNSTVTTDATLSRLSSLAYLALSGSMTLGGILSGSEMTGADLNVTNTIESTTSVTFFAQTEASFSSTNVTQLEVSPNATLNMPSTISISNYTNANSTDITQFVFSSSTMLANSTTQMEVSIQNATLTTSSTSSLSQTLPYPVPEQMNNTVTTTQFNNQTITVYVSTTVANITITQTTTVAATTVTQTSPVSNSTITVTNSTSSGH